MSGIDGYHDSATREFNKTENPLDRSIYPQPVSLCDCMIMISYDCVKITYVIITHTLIVPHALLTD